MVSKTIFIVLGAILLLQGYNGLYHNKEIATRALAERLKLLKSTRTDFINMSHRILHKAAIIMGRVLDDPNVISIKSDSMEPKLEEIRHFIKEYQTNEQNEENKKIDPRPYRRLYMGIVRKYDLKTKTFDTPEDIAIANSIKDNVLDDVNATINEGAQGYCDSFMNEVQNYYDSLNDIEKQDEIELLKLLEMLRAEPVVLTKGEKILKFMEGVDVANFLW